MVCVSAPGKCIIIGEHAMVYGEPAIVASVDKRLTVSLEKSHKIVYMDKRFDTGGNEWDVQEVLETADKLQEIWKDCSEKNNFTLLFDFIKQDRYAGYRKGVVGIVMRMLGVEEGVAVTIEGGVPVASGLGSSASLAVCLAKGIAELYGKSISLQEVNEIAFDVEKIVHGSPSGGDNSACCYGGLIWFIKGQPPTIHNLKEEITHNLENFVFVYTKKPEKSTGELVQQVMDMDPAVRDPIVKGIGTAAREMREVLAKKDLNRMKDIINFTHESLIKLGVSIPEIDKIHEKVKEIGGAAKGCGAVGGGIVLCYHEDKKKLISAIKELGFEPWEADLGVEGVRVDG